MNKKLKVALKRHSSEQGFALPVALGMGLIMVLVGTTMIIRGRDDQVTASAQKQMAQSLSTTETGVTRLQAFLSKYPFLSKFPSAQWTDTNVISRAADAYVQAQRPSCVIPATAKTNIQNDLDALLPGWKSVDSSDSRKGQFRVRSYTYSAPNGTTTIDGKTSQEASTALQVVIPATAVPAPPSVQPPSPPGLFLNVSNLTSNQTVGGDMWLNGCNTDESAPRNLDGTASPTRQSDIEPGGTFTVSSATTLPRLPPLPSVAPTTLTIAPIQDYYIARYNPDSGAAASLPSTLPTASDILNYPLGTQRDGSYAYRLGSITSGLTIVPGKKVTIYLTGNIDIGGNTQVNAGAPGNLKIFGSKDGAYCLNGTPTGTATGCNTTRISLSGTSELRSYLFAPGATAGLQGGGNSDRFFGAVWVNQWDMDSHSNKVVIGQQISNWSDFTWDTAWSTDKIDSISSWQRQEAAAP